MKFPEHYLDQQTPDEGCRAQQPKHYDVTTKLRTAIQM